LYFWVLIQPLRTILKKTLANAEQFKKQLLDWAQQFDAVVYLDSNTSYNESLQYSTYDCVLAVDAFTSIRTDYTDSFQSLHQYQSQSKDWLFGYLSYDLKNDTEDLQSANFDGLQFPDLYFFQPKKLFLITENELELHYLYLCDDELESDYKAITEWQITTAVHTEKTIIQQRIAKESYLEKVAAMLAHIQRGAIYEANFCMEFYATNATIEPLQTYQKLNAISEPPFAVFFKNKAQYLLCASPERYLKKAGTTVLSQPIKGTAKRELDVVADAATKKQLEWDPKERSENIMIVDLVRNDLSKTATKGSVQIPELCQVYSFKQVHQMISTITSEIENTTAPVSVIQTTFPMGSMTGAPKVSAMQIIESLEETKRGLYSGAVGYFTPEADFDFNVVIRSILYNAERNYLSFSVGSAITARSIPEKEYEECLLKAKAMFEVLR